MSTNSLRKKPIGVYPVPSPPPPKVISVTCQCGHCLAEYTQDMLPHFAVLDETIWMKYDNICELQKEVLELREENKEIHKLKREILDLKDYIYTIKDKLDIKWKNKGHHCDSTVAIDAVIQSIKAKVPKDWRGNYES
jgi:hypothetical protein